MEVEIGRCLASFQQHQDMDRAQNLALQAAQFQTLTSNQALTAELQRWQSKLEWEDHADFEAGATNDRRMARDLNTDVVAG